MGKDEAQTKTLFKDNTLSSFSVDPGEGPEEIFTSMYSLPSITEANLIKGFEAADSSLIRSKAYHSTHIKPK